MGKRKMQVIEWVCDNPECGNSDVEFPDGDPAKGFWVKGNWATPGGGGPIPEVYACSIECLAEAVKEGMYRD